jgi:hypothetical protein
LGGRGWWFHFLFLFRLFFDITLRVEIRNDVLRYRSLLQGQRNVTLDEIQKAKVVIGEYSWGEELKPFYRLEIYPYEATQKKPIIINLKVFKINDVRQILDWVDPKLKKR